ncbi:MAG TPA: twin-arginine translocation signal domain-containing protein [Planctomycetes bacterium]|nr:twin-arginine translocation signal domain-containing protein [Planctomycetota bacterium]
MDRRQFIKTIGAGVAGLTLSGCSVSSQKGSGFASNKSRP